MRVYIPKGNGKIRPLGIASYEDKIVQMAVKKVLEAIYEPRFLNCMYGFRPNRGCHEAVKEVYQRISYGKISYIVDADIKGFFDNVNHSKLIRQIWSLGIHDKTLIFIMKRILTAPIKMPDNTTVLPDKGTPQGGIISPLLANIVLNELDWWLACQWEENRIAISRGRERII